MKLNTFYTTLLLFCFLQSTALAASVEVYNFLSDEDSSISLSVLSVSFSDMEEEDNADHDEKEKEEKEKEDTDEEEFFAIYNASQHADTAWSYLQTHYLQSDYSVDLNITVQPPELD